MSDKFNEDDRLSIVERVGIRLDTPHMAQFWEAVQDFQEELKELCDELIEETAEYISDFVPTTGEPDVERPNVVINAVVANQHEYGGMDMSINLRQKRIWTGFDLMTYDNAEEFLDGMIHMLSWAAPNLVLEEEEGSDWTDEDLQWGEQYDGETND